MKYYAHNDEELVEQMKNLNFLEKCIKINITWAIMNEGRYYIEMNEEFNTNQYCRHQGEMNV